MVSTSTNLQTQNRRIISTEELAKIDAYWRACNYLAVGMRDEVIS